MAQETIAALVGEKPGNMRAVPGFSSTWVLLLTSRLKLQADGAYTDNSFQKSFAALAVLTAHVLTLKILRVSDVYFSLGLADEIAQREAECKLAWPGVENDCGRGM